MAAAALAILSPFTLPLATTLHPASALAAPSPLFLLTPILAAATLPTLTRDDMGTSAEVAAQSALACPTSDDEAAEDEMYEVLLAAERAERSAADAADAAARAACRCSRCRFAATAAALAAAAPPSPPPPPLF